MKAVPLNKFTAAALIWFVAAIYALLFKEGGNSAPPFPHFDKVGHFGLFFGQAWLCAKIFIQDNRNIPYKGILFAAFIVCNRKRAGSGISDCYAPRFNRGRYCRYGRHGCGTVVCRKSKNRQKVRYI